MIARERAIHSAVREACFGPRDEAGRDLAGLLDRHGVDDRDRRALLSAPARLPLYRKLVRGNVEGVCEAILERAYAHLRAHANGAWDAAIDAYLDGGGPRTAHLRDVPSELAAVLVPRLVHDARVPAYVADVVRLELAEFRVGAAADEVLPAELGDVAADRPVVFRGPSERLVCAHAAHLATTDPGVAVPAAETRLFVYRDAAHDVRVVTLTPFADAMLERLLRGVTLGGAIAEAAAVCGAAVSEALLTEVAKWLADFGERGVLLGAPR